MQEIVDREVERGPGTVDRRAGQVWRETRESLTGGESHESAWVSG